MSTTGIQPFIDQISWETSEDKTHQYHFCQPPHHPQLENLLMEIKRSGYLITIQGQAFICLQIGKHLYWTDWEPRGLKVVINRMPV